ncbi:Gag-pol Polyprotein, partial [Phytophthora palmivora]
MDKLPKSVRAALASPNREKWLEAMEAEFQSIQSNETWMLVKRPQNTKVMTSRWVFVIKRNQHGEIERYKARLTIRGSPQQPQLFADLSQRGGNSCTFYYDLDLRQIDFTTAFLNGDTDVDVYMEQPELFDDGSGRVCLLEKSLYGLKQAPLIWNETLKKYLLKLGFKASIIGDGVYVKWIGDSSALATISGAPVPDRGGNITHQSSVGDCGPASPNGFAAPIDPGLVIFDPMETDRVTLSQETYIRHLVEKFGTNNARI